MLVKSVLNVEMSQRIAFATVGENPDCTQNPSAAAHGSKYGASIRRLNVEAESRRQGSGSKYNRVVEKRLSINFGLLIGAMWMGEIVLGNLGGTSVFGDLRDMHPGIYAMAVWFALAAVCVTGIGGLVAAYQTGRISVALRVGVWSGLLSGSIVFVTGMGIVVLFHSAMMRDPSNIHEFARTAHRAPTEAELSSFLYRDMLGGALNHLWIGPFLGLTVGGIGAVFGKLLLLSDGRASVHRSNS
jgi:hypothetical protein